MKTWLTVSEGAQYAGVSRDTIYTACERRELRHARIGGRRSIRIKPEWIDGWLEPTRARSAGGRKQAIRRDAKRRIVKQEGRTNGSLQVVPAQGTRA
jgi:excisionase family DNA binding protein